MPQTRDLTPRNAAHRKQPGKRKDTKKTNKNNATMNDIQPITLPGIDPRRPLVIAGPCSAETEEQVLDTARSLAAEGIRICRAGLWKPRTAF